MTFTGYTVDDFIIDPRLPIRIDFFDQEPRSVIRERRRPKKFPVVAIQQEQSTTFADRSRNFMLRILRDRCIDPLHIFRIRIHGSREENALIRVVLIPVVARQVLVIPQQLAGFRIQRNCRIAVEIRRR